MSRLTEVGTALPPDPELAESDKILSSYFEDEAFISVVVMKGGGIGRLQAVVSYRSIAVIVSILLLSKLLSRSRRLLNIVFCMIPAEAFETVGGVGPCW